MPKWLFVLACVAALLPVASVESFGGPAFDSLSAAANADGGLAPVIFDGATMNSVVVPGNLPPVPDFTVRKGLLQDYTVPLPEMVQVTAELTIKEDLRASPEIALDPKTEKPTIDRAIKKLSKISSGKDLFNFFRAEGVEIRWQTLTSLGSDPAYAKACPPEVCGDRKVIYLNNLQMYGFSYKEMYLEKNPTFLAVTVAHELAHLSDYKAIGGSYPRGTSVHLVGEINARAIGIYVYPQLLISGVAPVPNSAEENSSLQFVRLELAIRDYVNGGKKPVAADYNKIGSVDGLSLDDYVAAVTGIPRRGSMSLAGIVERVYDLSASLENPVEPGMLASPTERAQYKQYKKVKQSLDGSTVKYLKWRKENVDPPASTLPASQPSVGGGNAGSGGGTGGGSGGSVDVDPGSWHPTQGSGQATWD